MHGGSSSRPQTRNEHRWSGENETQEIWIVQTAQFWSNKVIVNQHSGELVRQREGNERRDEKHDGGTLGAVCACDDPRHECEPSALREGNG